MMTDRVFRAIAVLLLFLFYGVASARAADTKPDNFPLADDASKRDYWTTFYVEAADVPEKICPVKKLAVTAEDGRQVEAAYRMPPGPGPFPAIILIHGGMSMREFDSLAITVRENPVHTRYLTRGYATVSATYRTYEQKPRDIGATLDIVATIEAVKNLPEVDPDSVVIYGGSGGGALCLEAATRAQLPAIGLGEPAAFLFAAYYTDEDLKNPDELNRRTKAFRRGRQMPVFSDEEQAARYKEKLEKITCPMLLMQGNVHPVNTGINRSFKPALEAAGKDVTQIEYPGLLHGFYFGRHQETTLELIEKVVGDVTGFFEKHIKVMPKPIELDQ